MDKTVLSPSNFRSGDRVSAAMEDCLEVIERLQREQGSARVRDLAAALSIHKSTVTAALKLLTRRGLVAYARYGTATLTPAGRRIAERTRLTHVRMADFIGRMLLVDDGVAAANACRMEHVLDAAVRERLATFGRFVAAHPRLAANWRRRFGAFVAAGAPGPADAEVRS